MKKTLLDLPVVADAMLAGLRIDAELRARILDAHRPVSTRRWPRWVAVISTGAIAAAVGIAALISMPSDPDGTMPIEIHAAGDSHLFTDAPILLADVPEGSLSIGSGSASSFRSLFAGSAGDFPLVGYDGGAYRMLTQPSSLGKSHLGSSLGNALSVSDPSQADSSAWYGLISNAANADAEVYAVSGLSAKTAVATEVDGQLRLFQRYSYGGYGPGGSLESVLDVRGKVQSLDLSGVGKVTDGDLANALIDTLLDNAVLKSNDVTRSKEALNIELKSGLTLQLLVSQNTFSACGSWSCPEFIEAFYNTLN